MYISPVQDIQHPDLALYIEACVLTGIPVECYRVEFESTPDPVWVVYTPALHFMGVACNDTVSWATVNDVLSGMTMWAQNPDAWALYDGAWW